MTENRLSKEHLKKQWEKLGKICCSICGAPVYHAINPEAIYTCAECMMMQHDKYERERDSLQGEIIEGSQLKQLRKINSLSQRQFSEKVGLSVHYVRDLEQGKSLITNKIRKRIKEMVKNGEISLMQLPS